MVPPKWWAYRRVARDEGGDGKILRNSRADAMEMALLIVELKVIFVL